MKREVCGRLTSTGLEKVVHIKGLWTFNFHKTEPEKNGCYKGLVDV